MVFEDRLSAYPNRYRLTTADGDESVVFLERADEPIRAGTPLNADTFNDMQSEMLSEIPSEMETYPGCKYQCEGDSYFWYNPPMLANNTYLTMERFFGERVSVRAIRATLLGTTGSFGVTAIPVFEDVIKSGHRVDVIDFCGTISNDEYGNVLPLNYYFTRGETEIEVTTSINGGVAVVNYPPSLAGYTIRLVVKYVIKDLPGGMVE